VLTQLVSSPDLPGCNDALPHRLSAPAAREDEVRNDCSFFSGMGRQRRRRVLSLGEWSKAIRKLLDDLSSRQTRELFARPGFLRQSICCAVAVTPRLRSCAGGDAYAARFNVECAASPIITMGCRLTPAPSIWHLIGSPWTATSGVWEWVGRSWPKLSHCLR
jgi:hypothetical protein